jgi:hypothetical protein
MTSEMKHSATPPGRRLLESCENEAHLTLWADALLTQDTLQFLINRLHIQRDREGGATDYRAAVYNGTEIPR